MKVGAWQRSVLHNARLHRRRIALGKAAALVPIGIGQRRGAGGVEPGDLRGGQVPAHRAEVLAQLLLVAGADDHRRHRRPLQAASSARSAARSCRSRGPPRRARRRPDRHIRRAPAGRCRSTSLLLQPADLRQRLAAADLAGQPPPAQRAPDDRADPSDPAPAASAPIRSRARRANNRPGGRRSEPGRTSPRRPATSSNASRKNSSSRCSGSCRRAPGRRACASTSSTGVMASKPCS